MSQDILVGGVLFILYISLGIPCRLELEIPRYAQYADKYYLNMYTHKLKYTDIVNIMCIKMYEYSYGI